MKKIHFLKTVFVLNLFCFVSCFALKITIAQTTNNKKVISSVKYKLPSETPDIIEEKLLGNVKSVKELYYVPQVKFEKLYLGEPFRILIKNYNSDGYLTLWNQKVSVEVETIEDKALCCGEGDISEGLGITIMKYTYDYTEKTKTQEYKEGESLNSLLEVNKYTTKYEDGITTDFDSEGNIVLKTIVKKGANGVKVTTEYNAEGEINYKKTESSSGSETIYEDGSIEREKSYKNENGDITESWHKSKYLNEKNFTLVEKEIKNETQKELRKTVIFYKNGLEDERRITVLDKTTNLAMEYFQIPKTGKKYHFKYEYEFDSIGNWTSKTSLSEVTKFGKIYFEPYLITKREISYY